METDPRGDIQGLYEGLVDKLEIQDIDFIEAEVEEIHNSVAKALEKFCAKLGHSPVADQCNRPEHDYCRFCATKTPGLATRRVVK